MPEKALIAMSGGVDSSVAAFLMLKKGYQCTGFSLRLIDDNDAGWNDARQAAGRLGMPHYVFDFIETFRNQVILPFIKTYEEGATPNPCINCNRHVKFAVPFLKTELQSAMQNPAEQTHDFDFFATGHYAQTEKSGSRWLLKKAVDFKKDQSYVLFSLGQEILAISCFPLGSLTKSEVKEIAATQGIINPHKPESQDICFVPGGDYGAFIEAYTGKSYPQGDILDMNGKIIGRHKGHIRYTLGQRRGLGVAANEPVYVCAKDTKDNTITLGPETALYSKTLYADRINFIACENLEKPMKLKVKTRYLQQEHSAWAVQTGPDEICVDFDEAQRAMTPGQAAVLYDGDIVVGGGIIHSVT